MAAPAASAAKRSSPIRAAVFMATAAAMILSGSPSVMAQAPAQAPAKDSENVVAPVVVRPLDTTRPSIGKGAPEYTPKELDEIAQKARMEEIDANSAVRRCGGEFGAAYGDEADASTKVQRAAEKAKEATLAANAALRAEAAGIGTELEVINTEVARQQAVNAMNDARTELAMAMAYTAELQQATRRGNGGDPLLDIKLPVKEDFVGGVRTVSVPPEYKDLVVEGIVARELSDKNGSYLLITGRIKNTRPRPLSIPSLAFAAVDRWGFPLKTAVANPKNPPKVAPGATAPFTYIFRPSPAKVSKVVVTFATDRRDAERLPVGMFCEQSRGGQARLQGAARRFGGR